jgi:hypothetical protein
MSFQDVLRDFEVICELIFSQFVADGSASKVHARAQTAVPASGLPRRHATHALGRLIDLLQASLETFFCFCCRVIFSCQSLWTLTNSDVCETLEGSSFMSVCCCRHDS